MRPCASACSVTLYAGMPASSLMRALSATKGQIASGGWAKCRSLRYR